MAELLNNSPERKQQLQPLQRNRQEQQSPYRPPVQQSQLQVQQYRPQSQSQSPSQAQQYRLQSQAPQRLLRSQENGGAEVEVEELRQEVMFLRERLKQYEQRYGQL